MEKQISPQMQIYKLTSANNQNALCVLPLFYTGPEKFLNGRIFYLCSPFTRNRANSVTYCSNVYRSKTCKAPRVPCKRKVGPCKFFSVQKLFGTCENRVSVNLVPRPLVDQGEIWAQDLVSVNQT